MSSKTVQIDGVGDVVIIKRRGQRSIRVTVNGSVVRVSQPIWLPFSAGEAFIKQRQSWVAEHLKPSEVLIEGSSLGSTHTLHFVRGNSANLRSKLAGYQLIVQLPPSIYPQDAEVQEFVRKKQVSLLRTSAEDYLPKRVAELAGLFDYTYKSVQVKQLKRRWGSCNSKKELTFNLNLVSLDPLHVDYVILHELTHTVHMNHGSEFWAHLESVLPNAKKIAKAVRHAPSS